MPSFKFVDDFDSEAETRATVVVTGEEYALYISQGNTEEPICIGNSKHGDKVSLYAYTNGQNGVAVERGKLFYQYRVDEIEHVVDGKKAV